MSESKLENLTREKLLEKLCLNGYDLPAIAAEYDTSIEKVRQYLYDQGFSRNVVKRESLIMLRGKIYDTENALAMDDLLMHPAEDITDALVTYLSGALSRAEKGEKAKQVFQKALAPLVSSLLHGEWLKLLLFVDNQPLPEGVLRYPAEGYLNQLLQEYANKLPVGYRVGKETAKARREQVFPQKDKPAAKAPSPERKPVTNNVMPKANKNHPSAPVASLNDIPSSNEIQKEDSMIHTEKEDSIISAAEQEQAAPKQAEPETVTVKEEKPSSNAHILPDTVDDPIKDDKPLPAAEQEQASTEAQGIPEAHKLTTPTSILVGEVTGRMPETEKSRNQSTRKRPIMGNMLIN